MPGVPNELKDIWKGSVQSWLEENNSGLYYEEIVEFGITDESVFAPYVNTVMESHPSVWIKSMPKIIRDIEQGSIEWDVLRLGSVGGSGIKKVLTKGRAGKPSKTRITYKRELAQEIVTGEKTDSYVSDDMLEGTRREPESRGAFELITGLEVEQVGLIHGDIPRTHVSPDGLTSDGYGLELKNPKIETHIKYIDMGNMVPIEYIAQVQYSMWITNCEYWYFFSYYPGLKSLLLKVERDEKFIKEMKVKLGVFLKELDFLVKKMQ